MLNKKINITQVANKAVPNPIAQYTTLSQHDSGQFEQYVRRALKFISNEKNFIVDRVVMYLALHHGLRISEILNINPVNIDRLGGILIRGAKSSQARYVSSGRFSEWLFDNRLFFCNHLLHQSRFSYYRLFKKNGIYVRLKGHQNGSVTHLFRHNFVQVVQNSTNDYEITSGVVGHKNSKNTEIYGKSKI